MDNFDFKKYLAEGTLLKEDKKYYSDYLEVDQNEYDNLKDRIDTEFDGNMEDFLEEFAIDFLSPNIEKINKYYGRKLSKYDVSELITDFYEADGLKFISSNEKFEFWLDRNREFYLAEGEDFKNPILDKYLEIKKSIDNKTVFDYELSDFINDLDNTERKGLESDLGLERDELYEGVIKENITKLDNYALEIYSDFRKDPSIHFPDVEFEVDEEGFALENDSNYSQLKKYKREIMGLHALFGEESGVKDKNGLQLSMDGVIDNI